MKISTNSTARSNNSYGYYTMSGPDIKAAKKQPMSTIHLDYNLVARRNNLQDTIKLPCETKIDTTQSNNLPYDERTRYKR